MKFAEYEDFIRAFVAYSLSTVLIPCAELPWEVVMALEHIRDISNYNSAGYVLQHILTKATSMLADIAEKKPRITLHGCLLYLQVFYLELIRTGRDGVDTSIYPRMEAYKPDILRNMIGTTKKNNSMGFMKRYGRRQFTRTELAVEEHHSSAARTNCISQFRCEGGCKRRKPHSHEDDDSDHHSTNTVKASMIARMTAKYVAEETKKNMESFTQRIEKVAGKRVLDVGASCSGLGLPLFFTADETPYEQGTVLESEPHRKDPLARLKQRLSFDGKDKCHGPSVNLADHKVAVDSASNGNQAVDFELFNLSPLGTAEVPSINEIIDMEQIEDDSRDMHVIEQRTEPVITNPPKSVHLVGEAVEAQGRVHLEAYLPQADLEAFFRQQQLNELQSQASRVMEHSEGQGNANMVAQAIQNNMEFHINSSVPINTISLKTLCPKLATKKFFNALRSDENPISLSSTFVAIDKPEIAILPGIRKKLEMTKMAELSKETFSLIARLYNEIEGTSTYREENPSWKGTYYFPPTFAFSYV